MGALGVPASGDGGSSEVAVTVPGVTDAISIGAGADSSCALGEDGIVRCWGALDGTPIERDTTARLCYVTARCTDTPIAARGGPYVALAMNGHIDRAYYFADGYRGRPQSCTTDRSGAVVCRGDQVDSTRWRSDRLPLRVDLLRVGQGALCVSSAGSVYCRAQYSLLGAMSGAIPFAE